MNKHIINWTERVKKEYQIPSGKVLDIGSLNVNGTVKHLFSDATEYIGIDFREGKDVDMVINAHDILVYFMVGTFDTIICMDMFEHDDAFWLTLSYINNVLKKGGYLWVVQPTIDFPIHNHPGDYWRATEQAFKEVYFKGYTLLNLETIYTKDKNGNDYDDLQNEKGVNPVLCAVGRKT